MARGDQHPGSDVDRFVKVDSKDRDLVWSIRDQTCIIAEEETGYEPVLSPLIMSSDQFDELLSGPGVTEARASLPARSASSRKS